MNPRPFLLFSELLNICLRNVVYGAIMSEEATTIRIRKSTKDILDSLKIHPRETYEDVILRLIKEKRGEK